MLKNNRNSGNMEKVNKIRDFYFAVCAIEEYQEELRNCTTKVEIINLAKEKNFDIDGEIFEQGIRNAFESLPLCDRFGDGKTFTPEWASNKPLIPVTNEVMYQDFLKRLLGYKYLKSLGIDGIQ
ncbi:hypothetical protein WJM97_11205 [Okeanomitos corallinicola TIOX110]|uniref:Uncharacterized protein n=1 Tax=Okeanomitos corallinicola TIOX110 TaxID=3133117 RepID=A0ABZ2UKT2_9CYAN